MLKTLLAAIALMAPVGAGAGNPHAPATVVVAFDRETIIPLIVEGVANRETGRPVAANDPVRIASISKLIMALATLRLVDEGVVQLNADVSGYLGWTLRHPDYPDAKITLAQLLSHRSGLRDRAGYIVPLGESLQDKLADPEVWHDGAPPGETPFEYANLGSPVVATVLEAATGERYDALLERLVFAPLDIDACTNWVGCSDEMAARAVTLYRDTGEIARDAPADLPPNCTVPVADGSECDLDSYLPGTNASIFSPQGGVRIGMMDLARIGQALLAEREDIFPRTMMLPARFHLQFGATKGQEFFCIYGLGMQVIEAEEFDCEDGLFKSGVPWLGHAGEAYGLRSGLWFSTTAENHGFAYFTTAVPPRQSAEDEGGFSARELALMQRAQELFAAMKTD